jgi:trehalose 6-phosphate phosphatase
VQSIDGVLPLLATTPCLLVATDFDGTLAPIVDDPQNAWPLPRNRRALATLARQPHTRAAVVSGRSLADLEARLQPAEDGLLLVGSHGSEFEPALTGRLSPGERRLVGGIRTMVEASAAGLAGVGVEHKDARACTTAAPHAPTRRRRYAAFAGSFTWPSRLGRGSSGGRR